jgi:hypothetical protein
MAFTSEQILVANWKMARKLAQVVYPGIAYTDIDTQEGWRAMVGRISLNALLIMVWVAAMWAIGPERIIGFQHIFVLIALATSGAMLAAAIGVNSAWNRRFE